MRHHKYIVFVFIITLIAVPVASYAKGFGLTRPTGGRVLSAKPTAAIACSAIAGPIFIKPVVVGVSGPFFIRVATKMTPREGGLILGNYTVTPDVGTCYNPETGAPVTAYELKPYGASR